MKTSKKIIALNIFFNLVLLSSCSSDTVNPEPTPEPEPKVTEQFATFKTPDYFSSIDIPYYEGDELGSIMGFYTTPQQMSYKYVQYNSIESVRKSQQYFKDKGEYISTKDIKDNLYDNKGNVTGYAYPFLVLHDNYYYVLYYNIHDSNSKEFYSGIGLESLFFTAEIQHVSGTRYYYARSGIPFPYLSSNYSKVDISVGTKEYQYTYEDLNENSIFADMTFDGYDSIKKFYQSNKSDYIVEYNDEDQIITLKAYDFDNKKWTGRYFYVACTEEGVTVTIDFTKSHYE